ncbi:MAG: hypothetical protein AAGC74_08760 [Verrucomicrobiota bacterium]
MPIDVLWENEGAHLIASEPLTLAEIRQSFIGGFYDDERSLTVKFQIMDFSKLESDSEFPMQEEDVVYFIATDTGRAQSIGKMKTAFVGECRAAIAMAEFYMGTVSKTIPNWEFSHFNTLEEAKSWLGLA